MAIRVLKTSTFGRLIKSITFPYSHSFSTNSGSLGFFNWQESQQRTLIPLCNLFRRYGFPTSKLHDFITKNRYLLNTDLSDLDKSLKILLSLNLNQRCLISMVYNRPQVLQLDFLKKWKAGITEMGISTTTSGMIQSVLELSQKYDIGPDDLSRCMQSLKGLGFSNSTVSKVLEELPTVIMMDEERILRIMDYLQEIGIHKSEIDWIFSKFPTGLALGVENKLKPLISEFRQSGNSLDEIKKEILRDPRILGFELGELSKILQMLRSLKCRVKIKGEIFLGGPLRASCEGKLRIDCLCKYGLIYTEAFTILWKEPRAILYGVKDIEEKIEFLINMMNFNVKWLVEVPEYLGMNFEKQIVRRHNVIDYLRSKGALGDEVNLKSIIKPSRHRFYNLYVKPYPECEQIYGKFSEVIVKKKHPEGMWKLFKPPKYPDSNEDVENIKSFVQGLV